jgi:hypothetical protein
MGRYGTDARPARKGTYILEGVKYISPHVSGERFR